MLEYSNIQKLIKFINLCFKEQRKEYSSLKSKLINNNINTIYNQDKTYKYNNIERISNSLNNSFFVLLEGKNVIEEALKNNVLILILFVDKSKYNTESFINLKNSFLHQETKFDLSNIIDKALDNILINRKNNENYNISCINFLKILKKLNYQKNRIISVDQEILSKISSTKTPYPFIGVGVLPEKFSNFYSINSLLIKNKNDYLLNLESDQKFILLENIQDPGNLGTIIRTSVAFGFKNILLIGDTVFQFSPKVIRGSAGNIFSLNSINSINYNNLELFKTMGYTLIGLSSHSNISINELLRQGDFNNNYKINPKGNNNHVFDLKEKENFNAKSLLRKVIFCFGNEGKGITEKFKNYIDIFVKIPIENEVESLNLSISVSIIEYFYYILFNQL